MIMHINHKLNLWAEWVATGRKVVGLGYPSQCSFTRLTPTSNGVRMPIENEEAWEIEKAVHRLDRQLRNVVEQFYLRAGTAETHAKALRCCKVTMYARLHQAHVRIMEWLQYGDEDEPVVKKHLTSMNGLSTKTLHCE